MRGSIGVIKWCSVNALLFLLLTYIASVNYEIHFISVNSEWVSNSFFITIFGGLFTSILVVELCEIQKYLRVKADTEQFIFYHSLYLYMALKQMKVNIEDYLNSDNWLIPENLFDESVRVIQGEIHELQNTDYATFRNDDKTLMKEHERFRIETLPKIQPFLQSGTRLRIAIVETEKGFLQDQLNNHIFEGLRKQITIKDPKVTQTLINELNATNAYIGLVGQYIALVNMYCKDRYKWDDMKEKLVVQHIKETDVCKCDR